MKNGFIELVLSSIEKEALRKLVFSRPKEREELRVSGRLVKHKGRRLLALEYALPGDTVRHKNVGMDMLRAELSALLSDYRQANLLTAAGDVEYQLKPSGREVLLGADKLRRKLLGEGDFVSAVESLDLKKNYILRGDEDFLVALGVSDSSGRVHDKKQGKFRQINRFLEHIRDIESHLPAEGELLIYDLCCGKSYLSFAVYYYLTKILSREVRLLGIDLKRDVIKWCSELADSLGYRGMTFICDDIKSTPTDRAPDMVISLHACDIATDIVLTRAVELGAPIILSTPCCHRYLRDKISAPQLEFITRFPQLANKLAEAATDALRLLRLEAAGYRVSALELTDPDDTPKNTLLRAIRTRAASATGAKGYENALAYLLGDGAENYLLEIKK